MRPWSLLFTLYGDPIRYYGGEVTVAGLIRMMAEFGVTEGAVRAAVHRMTQQDWLENRRESRASYYSLTEKGIERIEDASKRVYRVDGETWDGRWRLFNYSIPESHRKVREKLRKEMEWLGYGTLSGNTWIAPFDHMRQVQRLIRQYQVEDYVQLFVAEHVGPYQDRELVRKCWNLEAMKALYQQFIDTFAQRLSAVRSAGRLTDNQAFVLKTELVHEYRKFLFLDPGLPDRLLEADWTGRQAAQLFREWYLELDEQATRFFEAVCGLTEEERTIPHPFLANGMAHGVAGAERTVERRRVDETGPHNRPAGGSERAGDDGNASAV